MVSIKQLGLLIRLSHWSKAAFVLLGVFYAGAFNYIPVALLAALAFCFIASAVYIYNDLQDEELDRLHPHKQYRPLAYGEISFGLAFSLLVVLLLTGFLLAWCISTTLAIILLLYLFINLLYNHLLKNLPVFDVLCIASGFMLRVLAGTIGIGLPISWWLTWSATLISLFIALCKRRLEKQLGLKHTTRIVLKKYSASLLDTLIIITAVSSFITYFLYTIYAREESFYFLLTLPFAAIGLWRFAWLTTGDNHSDDPISLFLNDNLSRFNVLCFILLTLIAQIR